MKTSPSMAESRAKTRSFCYVNDLVEGLLPSPEQSAPVNLGNPGEFTMLELAQMVLRKTRSKSKLVFRDLPEDDPRQRRQHQAGQGMAGLGAAGVAGSGAGPDDRLFRGPVGPGAQGAAFGVLMLSGVRVLVTGGLASSAHMLARRWPRPGALPVVFDNLSTGHADAVRFGPAGAGRCARRIGGDGGAARSPDRGGDAFAASAYVGESVVQPGRYYDNNLGGMIGLLAGCAAAGVGRIVLSSSCATYGVPAVLPITEDTPQQPINPYGVHQAGL